METEKLNKAKVKHPDRVTLNPEAIGKIREWIMELEDKIKGIKVNKSDLVNFLILNRPENLTEDEIKKLNGKFFDEVRFTTWALNRIKEAKSQGREINLLELINSRSLPESI